MKIFYFKKVCGMVLALLAMAQGLLQGIVFDTVNGPNLDKAITVTWTPTFTGGPNPNVHGFVNLQAGFNISNTITTTVLFAANQPVVGNINLQGQTLKLTADMYLGRGANFVGPGFVLPNGFSIYFQDDATVSAGKVYVMGTGTFVGGGANWVLSSPGSLDWFQWADGTMRNLTILNVSNSTFKTYQSTGSGTDGLSLINVNFNLVPGTSFTFNWQTPITGTCGIHGTESTFSISENVFFIQDSSTLYVAPDVTLALANPAGGIGFTDNSSVLLLDNANLIAANTNNPARFFFGQLAINGNSFIGSLFGAPLEIGQPLIGAAADHEIVIYPGSTLTLGERLNLLYQNSQ